MEYLDIWHVGLHFCSGSTPGNTVPMTGFPHSCPVPLYLITFVPHPHPEALTL